MLHSGCVKRHQKFRDFVGLPMGLLREESPKNRKLILYCDHGGGSMQMARMLGEQGYHVASVVGGYEAMKKISKNYFKNRENM